MTKRWAAADPAFAATRTILAATHAASGVSGVRFTRAALVVAIALTATGTHAATHTLSLAARAKRFPPVTESRAAFEQEREVSLVDEVLRASGTITLRAPDHMRLELAVPDRLTIAMDGDAMQVLDAQGKVIPVPPEFSGFARFGRVLTDLMLGGKALERFREEWHGPDAVTLRPEDANASPFSEVTLRFPPDGPLANEIVLRESGGDRTIIRLRPLGTGSAS